MTSRHIPTRLRCSPRSRRGCVPTLFEGILETHDGPEPTVRTSDVQAILRRVVRPGDDDGGNSVPLIAERAGVSTRTVYRVLSGQQKSLSLEMADNLVMACGYHLAECTLVWPDGSE